MLDRLSEIKTPNGFVLLLEQLTHPHPTVKARSARLLGRDPRAVPALMQAIRIEDDRLQARFDAAARLEILQSGDDERILGEAEEYNTPLNDLLAALGRCASGVNEALRESASVFLASLLHRTLARYTADLRALGVDSAEELNLTDMDLIDPNFYKFVEALGWIRHPAAVPVLLEAVYRDVRVYAGHAWDALKEIYEAYPDPAIRQQIVDGAFEALCAGDAWQYWGATRILQAHGAAALPRLTSLMTDPDPLNRRGAVVALVRLLIAEEPILTDPEDIQRTIVLLTAALNDPDNEVRLRIDWAFFEILKEVMIGKYYDVDQALLQIPVHAMIRLISDQYGDDLGTVGHEVVSTLEHIVTEHTEQARRRSKVIPARS